MSTPQVSERAGQISFFLLMDHMRKKGLQVNSAVMREADELTKNLNSLGITPKVTRAEVIGTMVELTRQVVADFEARLEKLVAQR
jgi:hypothetical protein